VNNQIVPLFDVGGEPFVCISSKRAREWLWEPFGLLQPRMKDAIFKSTVCYRIIKAIHAERKGAKRKAITRKVLKDK